MRMYVIVNKDMGKKIRKRGMTNKYHHVQATHAVAEYCNICSETARKWGNQTLIVLSANERQFLYYGRKIFKARFNMATFIEPDLNHEVTAFACVLEEKDFGIFKRLELL